MQNPGDLANPPSPVSGTGGRRPRHRLETPLKALLAVLVIYLLAAYVFMPYAWKHKTRRHPALYDAPTLTHTPTGIPGDPINVALLGSETNVLRAMHAAGWYPANPLTLSSSLRIAVDSVLRRPDDEAPVSTLLLFGRKEDLAFEQPVGDSPRQRHHVRFWHWDKLDDGHEVWFGAITYDESVGLSHTTGQVTHHIGPDVDAERDRLMKQLQAAGQVTEISYLDGFQKELSGKNGGGDPWHTDGRLGIATLKDTAAPAATAVTGGGTHP
ncbi:MAG: LssY C-terminal domain-containing protein [Verrucomicrobiota bacterium]